MEQINKYQNAKIYKIINDDLPNLVYYGSTIQTLKKRFSEHKSKYNTSCSKILFSRGTPEIILIQHFPCNNRKELELIEKQYIKGYQCINYRTPGQTLDERKEKK